jgi:hypothetical protein
VWQTLFRSPWQSKVSFCHHSSYVVRREDFKKSWSIRKMNCLWRPCLLTDWEQMSKLYRELSIDAEYKHIYQVLCSDCSFSFDPLKNMAATGNSCFWLVNFYKSSPLNLSAPMNWNLVGSIYEKPSRTFYPCCLPSFIQLGKRFLEEKVCAEIDQSETRITCGCHVCKRIGIK